MKGREEGKGGVTNAPFSVKEDENQKKVVSAHGPLVEGMGEHKAHT